MAADEVIDHDPSLALVAVIEADDDHTVALWASAPAVGAVVLVDFAQFDQVQIAVGADVVVAGGRGDGRVVCVWFGGRRVAGTVETGVGTGDGVMAYVAVGREG